MSALPTGAIFSNCGQHTRLPSTEVTTTSELQTISA